MSNIKLDIAKRVTEQIALQANSQLGRVIYELSTSTCKHAGLATDPKFKNELYLDEWKIGTADRIKDVLEGVVYAFHHWELKNVDGGTISAFELNPKEFLEQLPSLDGKQDMLKRAYGQLWVHARAADQIRDGKLPYAHEDYMLFPNLDSVAHVAGKYINEVGMHSEELERALISALMHCRIQEFMKGCIWDGLLRGLPNGQRLEGPLLAGSTATPFAIDVPAPGAWKKALLPELATRAGALIGNAIAMAVWWGIAAALTDGTSKWVFFTGMTAAGWITTAIINTRPGSSDDDKSARINEETLWAMNNAHDKVPSMNIKLIEYLLFVAEEKGAYFHPIIYKLLDKAAKREKMNQAR